MREINFLASQIKDQAAQEKKDRQYFLIALGLLAAVIIAWLGILAYNTYLNAQAEDLRLERNQAEQRLSQLANSQIPYLTYVNKTKAISEIINNRKDALELIELVSEYLMALGVEPRSINYAFREAYFEVSLQASNIFLTEIMFAGLENEEFKDQFASIDYGALSRDPNGRYTTTVTFNLK